MPSVVLVSLDAMRHDGIRGVSDLGWWEKQGLAEALRTPNLDRFASECYAFGRCYGTSSFTPPSHASMVTGRYVPAHGVKTFFHSMRPGPPSLAGILRGHGYVTVAWYENECLDYCGVLRDFDEAYNYHDHTWADFVKRLADLQATFPGKVFAFIHIFDLHSPYMMSLRTVGQQGAVDEYFDGLAAVLRELGLFAPKWLMRGISRLMERRAKPAADTTPTRLGERICTNGELLAEWMLGDQGDVDFRARAYTHGISHFDAMLWPTIEGDLREAGLIGDDTLTVVTSDHGEAPTHIFSRYRFAHKVDMVEGTLRVPLLLRCPAFEAPAVDTAQLASLVDIVPTVLRAVDIAAHELELDGVDLFGAPDPDRAIFAEGEHFQQARWDKWAFRRGQEEGTTCLWERAVVSGGLKLVRRGNRALLEGLASRPPAQQIDTLYRAVVGRLASEREIRLLTGLLERGETTVQELVEVAIEAVEEQGEAEKLIDTNDLEEAVDLSRDPAYAERKARLGELLDGYSSRARAMAPTPAGYDDEDEQRVMERLAQLGYL